MIQIIEFFLINIIGYVCYDYADKIVLKHFLNPTGGKIIDYSYTHRIINA